MTYKIGTSAATLTELSSLTVPLKDPRATYQPYSQQIRLGSGKIRGIGFPVVSWRWGFLTQSQRDQLREYVENASEELYIETEFVDNSDAFVIAQVVATWPMVEERDTTRRLDFVMDFMVLNASFYGYLFNFSYNSMFIALI